MTGNTPSLKDKVIIVTGAGSGIGLATSLLLAEAGAKVLLSGRTGAKVEATVRRITEAGGIACAVEADVSREADVVAMVDRAVAEYGCLDGAFNNAGVEMHNKLVDDLETDDWDSVLGTVNLSDQGRGDAGIGRCVGIYAATLTLVTSAQT